MTVPHEPGATPYRSPIVPPSPNPGTTLDVTTVACSHPRSEGVRICAACAGLQDEIQRAHDCGHADAMRSMLTPAELEAMSAIAAVVGHFATIVGQGPTRDADMREVVNHIHALQAMVMSQAACRAYPTEYRLLGESMGACRYADEHGIGCMGNCKAPAGMMTGTAKPMREQRPGEWPVEFTSQGVHYRVTKSHVEPDGTRVIEAAEIVAVKKP